MEPSDRATTRAAKRRRLSAPIVTPRPPTRSVSPDELAAESSPEYPPQRTPSIPVSAHETQRPRYSPFTSREGSPDELDHTSQHTFYRGEYHGSFSIAARQSYANLRIPSKSRSPPPYSRISTPIATPEPGQERKEATYVSYTQHMLLKGHKKGVAAVRFSPDGNMIASCSADATIRIWDTKTGKQLYALEGHLAGISTIAWSPDGKTLASGSDDKSIRLWNISKGKPYPHPLLGHHHYIYSLAFSPKGNILVSGSYDEAVFLWDVRTQHILRSLPAHSDPVGGVDFVRDGTLIASCAGDGLIRIWDTGTGQCLRTLVHEDNAPVTSVRFSPNGKFVLAWTLDSCVRLWNYVEGRCVKTYQGHTNSRYSIGGAFGVYGADDEAQSKAFVASGSDDGLIVCWDVVDKQVLQTIGGHEGVVLGVDSCPKSGLMVSGGIDKTVRIWKRHDHRPSEAVADGDMEVRQEEKPADGL